jgi:hypothetical protein
MMCKPDVDVVLTPDVSKDPVKWTMDVCGGVQKGSGGFGNYPPLVIGYDKPATDHHLVYLIDNPAGSTWHFAKDAAALWVTSAGADPTKTSTDPHVPVNTIHTSNPSPPNPATADTQLKFTDKNDSQNHVTLHYTLNFVNGQKTASTLDPIIDNGGCCTRSGGFWADTSMLASNATFDAWVAIAFLAGVLATLAARRFTRRGSDPSQSRTGP